MSLFQISILLQWLFLASLVATTSYAVLGGGWVERTGVIFIAFGSLLSPIAIHWVYVWHGVATGLILVDISALVAFILLALVSDRLWTAWAAAFQIPMVAIDIWPLFMSGVSHRVVINSEVFWVYPTLLAIILGTRSHQRALRDGKKPV